MNKLHDLDLVKHTYLKNGYQLKDLSSKTLLFENFKDSKNFSKIYFQKENDNKAYLTQSIKVIDDMLVVCKNYEEV